MAHSSFHKFIFGFCTSLLIITTLSHGEIGLPSEEHVSLFIFGDSIFDAGNNNYINTSLRANFRPYGESFFKHPTGRFSDGRLISDFIAEYANLPFIPPYLQPGNHQFTYGANFASAGAGALVETSQGLVIDLHSQLSYFERVRESLTKNLGEEEANTLISRAVYLFSVGGNDYSYIFGTNSSILRTQSHREFVGTVLGNITAAINVLRRGRRHVVEAVHIEEFSAAEAREVIDLHSQLSHFERVRESLTKNLGDEEAKTLISRAVYLFSAGSNDYSYIFGTNSSILRTHSHREFVGMVLGNITTAIKEIYNKGGRKFGFLTLDPLGCIPFSRPLGKEGGCFEAITPYVQLHNEELPKLLQKLDTELKGFRYSLSNYNEFLSDGINNPSKYGFKEGKVACCGSGPFRGTFSCGGQRGTKEYDLCPNTSDHVFFDSGHPTERVNQQFAMLFWSGTPNSTAPYNLKALFEN
ncbi:hypothetical protein ACLB2K_062655 [Fragaria x ananassa]